MEVLDLRWNDAGTGAITLRFRTAAPARAEWQWQPALSYGPVPDSRDSERLVLGPALVYEHGGAEDTPRTEHTVTLGGLLPGESYYVRVRAARRGPEGAWREVVVTPQVPEPVPAPSGEPLKEWLLDLAARQAARQAEERRAVEGPATLAAYQARVREALQAGLGGLPERTPLCPRILGRLDRGDYSIENVVFEALPGFYVPGNLYLPREAAGPLPAVLGVCGHAVAAKSEPQIVQMTNVNLVRKGYVVLQIDAPGQNEMGWDGSAWSFADLHYNASGYAHSLVALGCLLVGQSLARYFLWDGIRAVDYLLTRPEVDPERIGIYGCSGGGGQAVYIAALDERIRAVVSMSMLYDTLATMQGPYPGYNRRGGESFLTEETYPLTALSRGLSYTSVAALIAPRALTIVRASRDAQPLWATQRLYHELRGLYERAGAPEQLALAVVEGYHCQDAMRQFAYWTFNRALGREEAGLAETHRDVLPSSVGPDGRRQPTPLDVAPHSSMTEDFGSETVRSLLVQEAQRLATARAARGAVPRERLADEVRRLLGLADLGPARLLEGPGEDGRAFLETGLGLSLGVTVLSPAAGATRPPALYLADPAASHAPAEAPEVRALLARGHVVLVPAPRGVGEAPLEEGEVFGLSTYHTRRTHDALAVGRPLFGLQVADARACLDVAAALDGGRAGTLIVGAGAGGLVALYAALLDGGVAAVATRGALSTYARFVGADLPAWVQGNREASVALAGVLRVADLPEIAAALAPLPVWLGGLVDGAGRALAPAEATADYAAALSAYRASGAAGRLRVEGDGDAAALGAWLDEGGTLGAA